MTLYHGTNADVESIDLAKGIRYKDFGQGFYLTPDRQTAVRMAQKKARLFGGTPTLITYEMDDAALQSDLSVKVFPEQAFSVVGHSWIQPHRWQGPRQLS